MPSGWFELQHQMCTKEGVDIIYIAWKVSGISETLKAGKFCLQLLDSFHDISPVVQLDNNHVDFNLRAVCELTDFRLSIGNSPTTDESEESCSESE